MDEILSQQAWARSRDLLHGSYPTMLCVPVTPLVSFTSTPATTLEALEKVAFTSTQEAILREKKGSHDVAIYSIVD